MNTKQLRKIKAILHDHIGKKEYTQRAIADRLGVTQAYICMALNGKCKPTDDMIAEFERLLNLLPESSKNYS